MHKLDWIKIEFPLICTFNSYQRRLGVLAKNYCQYSIRDILLNDITTGRYHLYVILSQIIRVLIIQHTIHA